MVFIDDPIKEQSAMDLNEKFYVVYTPAWRGRFDQYSVPTTRENADLVAKSRAAEHPAQVSYVLEAVSSTTLGKVRSTALKAPKKVKPVKPLKVKKGTPIQFV